MKCLFMSLAHFAIGLFISVTLICRNAFDTRLYAPLSILWIAYMFIHIGVPLYSSDSDFARTKFLYFKGIECINYSIYVSFISF